jgi:hypothetical protein
MSRSLLVTKRVRVLARSDQSVLAMVPTWLRERQSSRAQSIYMACRMFIPALPGSRGGLHDTHDTEYSGVLGCTSHEIDYWLYLAKQATGQPCARGGCVFVLLWHRCSRKLNLGNKKCGFSEINKRGVGTNEGTREGSRRGREKEHWHQ